MSKQKVLEEFLNDKVTGFNLNAQLGDGSGGNPEPNFQSIEFAGGIWDAYPYTITSVNTLR